MDLSETLVFIVPLRPKRGASEWHAVQQALQETLRSVKGSTRQDFLVVIAGHEEPDLGAAGDPRITFLRVPFDVPTSPKEGSEDMRRKRRFVAAWLRQKASKDCTFMFLDADDWISNRLVAYILATKGPDGFVVASGYKLDSRFGQLQLLRQDFDRSCGSSFILRLRSEELPACWQEDHFVFSAAHRNRRQACEAAGKVISEVSFPAVIYRINHTISLQFEKKGFKPVQKERLIPVTQCSEIFYEFGMNYHVPLSARDEVADLP